MSNSQNPVKGFVVDRAAIKFVGSDLRRPECILAKRDGSLWAGDARGGVLHIKPDGKQTLIAPQSSKNDTLERSREGLTSGTLPNGLAFTRNGDVLIANLGERRLEQLSTSGKLEILADSIDGRPLGQVNFVVRDSKGRIWISISSQKSDWMEVMRPDVADGSIALYENGRLRIVADNLRYTNEIRLDASEQWMYISETCGPYISRMRITESGELKNHEIFGPTDHGALTDGIAFDAHGNLWGTHVFTDRIFVITPEGDMQIVLDDAPPRESKMLMEAFYSKTLTADLMMNCKGELAPWMTSVTFGGPDLGTVYVGNVLGNRIPFFRSPVAGLPPVHWNE